jgi:hypothetical protein
MPTDNTKYTRLASGVMHVDETGIWMEPQIRNFPRLSNERWAEIYKWMEEYLTVGQYLNDDYFNDSKQ